jgi:hypothetical protein
VAMFQAQHMSEVQSFTLTKTMEKRKVSMQFKRQELIFDDVSAQMKSFNGMDCVWVCVHLSRTYHLSFFYNRFSPAVNLFLIWPYVHKQLQRKKG